jgi:RHS repeat-associated protein
VIGYADSGGNSGAIYAYGPHGEPSAWSGSRYSYTGQLMIPEAQLYNYKARVYDPVMGRFLQTDPIGYKSDINAYNYTRGDPINQTDPTGTAFFTCPGATFTIPGPPTDGAGDPIVYAPGTGFSCTGSVDLPVAPTGAGVGGGGGTSPSTPHPPVPPNNKKNVSCPGAGPNAVGVDNGNGTTYLPAQAPETLVYFAVGTVGGVAGAGGGAGRGSYWYTGADGNSYGGKFNVFHFYIGAGGWVSGEGGASANLNAFFGPSVGVTGGYGAGAGSAGGNPSGPTGGGGVGAGLGGAVDVSYVLPSGCPVAGAGP